MFLEGTSLGYFAWGTCPLLPLRFWRPWKLPILVFPNRSQVYNGPQMSCWPQMTGMKIRDMQNVGTCRLDTFWKIHLPEKDSLSLAVLRSCNILWPCGGLLMTPLVSDLTWKWKELITSGLNGGGSHARFQLLSQIKITLLIIANGSGAFAFHWASTFKIGIFYRRRIHYGR